MALRQQPDHVVVPRLANVRARPITLFQLLNAEMSRHVRHARPLRFIAHQANCFAPPRESADSISRKPYERGTAQGAVISPLLANIYLHYALDLWAERYRRRETTGDMIIVRYADDSIVGFEHEADARRFLDALRQRLAEFALCIRRRPG